MRRLFALAVLVAALSACSPEQWIRFRFDPLGQGDNAVRVATCESGLNPDAVSPGGGNHGLFQINNVHRANFEAVTGRPWADIYDPAANTQYARHLYEHQGWSPWTCRP